MVDDARDTSEAMSVLVSQAVTIGLTVDPKWSVDELAQKVLDAQLKQKARENEEFQKAKKVRVMMKRDGFPLADMKVCAGQTCDVPIELAKRWLALGVCERADPLPGE